MPVVQSVPYLSSPIHRSRVHRSQARLVLHTLLLRIEALSISPIVILVATALEGLGARFRCLLLILAVLTVDLPPTDRIPLLQARASPACNQILTRLSSCVRFRGITEHTFELGSKPVRRLATLKTLGRTLKGALLDGDGTCWSEAR